MAASSSLIIAGRSTSSVTAIAPENRVSDTSDTPIRTRRRNAADFAYSAHPIVSFPSADRVVANTILAGQQGTYRRIRPRVTQLLVGQTSALHLFEVRSTPLLMRMMPSMAWGRCVAEPIYQS